MCNIFILFSGKQISYARENAEIFVDFTEKLEYLTIATKNHPSLKFEGFTLLLKLQL